MSVTVEITVEDLDSRLDDFDSIRLYRDTSPTGAFSTLVTTITLVAGTRDYSFTDTAGSALSWYQYQFFDSGTMAESSFSSPFQSQSTRLSEVRITAVQRAGMGFRSAAESGTTSTLVDSVLRDQGATAAYLSTVWIYRPDAAADGDKVRRTTTEPFDPATGTLTVIRDWNNAPTSDETYEVYMTFPPYAQPGQAYGWNDAVRGGLRDVWFLDEVFVATGDGSATEFDLSPFPALMRHQLREVKVRISVNNRLLDVDQMMAGRWWRTRDNGAFNRTLVLSHIPPSGADVIVATARPVDPPYQDDDLIPVDFDTAVAATNYQFFDELNRSTAGQYAIQAGLWAKEFHERYHSVRPPDAVTIG